METRLRSAGILISGTDILLESLVDREVWGVPGGGVKSGESIEDACLREYTEEIGLAVECSRLAIVHENFWTDKGQDVREYGFYFMVTPAIDLDIRPGIVSLEGNLQFRWHPLSELGRIDFVPITLQGYLPNLPEFTLFVSSREESG